MRKFVANALYHSGALSALDAYWGADRLTVLAYHRITDATAPDFDQYRPNVSATTENFAQQMEYVARHFNVIKLETLVAHMTQGAALPPRPLLITFDDGYLDNYLNAFPILRTYNLPATIFLMTSRMEAQTLPWWDECAHYFFHTELTRVDTPLVSGAQLNDPIQRKAALESVMQRLKPLSADQQRTMLDQLAHDLETAPPPEQRLFVSWEQVRDLVAHNVACQPHTVNHPRLSALDAAGARHEIEQSCAAIAEQTDQEVLAFAYPYGLQDDYNSDTLHALRGCDVPLAFTLTPGPVFFKEMQHHPLQIPRILIQYGNTFKVFVAKLMGIHTFRSQRSYVEETK